MNWVKLENYGSKNGEESIVLSIRENKAVLNEMRRVGDKRGKVVG